MPYYFSDAQSLLFFLKMIPLPAGLHSHGSCRLDRSGYIWRRSLSACHVAIERGAVLYEARYAQIAAETKQGQGDQLMKWITRENANVDRVACPWLVRRFVDPDAEFIYVPADQVMAEAETQGATPYDIKGVELGHVDGRCSFESIMLKHGLMEHKALVELAKIVHAADVSADIDSSPYGHGLKAIAFGFAYIHKLDDHKKIEVETPMYDALYAFCQQQVEKEAAA